MYISDASGGVNLVCLQTTVFFFQNVCLDSWQNLAVLIAKYNKIEDLLTLRFTFGASCAFESVLSILIL